MSRTDSLTRRGKTKTLMQVERRKENTEDDDT